MKSVRVTSSICINFDKENNKESPEFEVGNNVSISTCKKNLLKNKFQIGLQNTL